MKLLVVALVFGAGDFLSHPGVGLWQAAFLSYLPVLFALEKHFFTLAILGMGLGGMLAWVLALGWLPATLTSFFSMGVIPAVLVTSMVVVVQALPYFLGAVLAGLLVRARLPSWLALALGVCVAERWTPVVIPYTHAVPLVETAGGRCALALVGRDLCAMLIVFGSGALYRLLCEPTRRRSAFWSFAATFTLLSVSAIFFPVGAKSPDAEKNVVIGVLQSHFPARAKQRDPGGVFSWHAHVSTAGARDQDPDFLIWGETMLSLPQTAATHVSNVAALGLPPVLFGAKVRSETCPTCPPTNSMLVSSECERSCRYDKQELVPGAESLWPASQYFAPQFRPRLVSSQLRDPINIDPFKIGTPICFEALFPKVIEQYVEGGAQFLVNVVGDGWLQSKMASSAMEGLTRLGAVEWGLPLVRLADAGGSAAWTSSGDKIASVVERQSGYFPVVISVPSRLSFYARHHEYFEAAMHLLLVLIAMRFSIAWARARTAVRSQ